MELTPSDAVWWYLHELSSRVVAESRKPTDRYHIGKILLQTFKDRPDLIMQIDGATDKSETFKSAMERSVQCASAFRNIGLKQQDVVILMAPNHLDVTIPMYAGLYLGIAVAGVHMHLGLDDFKHTLKFLCPKVIFCENFNVRIVNEATDSLNISPLIVTFGEKRNHMSFTEFIEKKLADTTVDNFRPEDLDPAESNALLVATSGSTGFPKAVALTHKNVYLGFPGVFFYNTKFPSPFEMTIILSPTQWISALIQFVMSPILKYTRVQSSLPSTPDHVYFLINKYRPQYTLIGATFLKTLLKPGERDKCDFSSFKYLTIGGSSVPKTLLDEIQKVAPNALAINGYGMSEASGIISNPIFSPHGSIGVLHSTIQYKIVDPLTNEIIRKPNVTGELILKGPTIAKGYYNNPKETEDAFRDGWYRTGDLIYRDEYYNLYFVDRLKLMLKYKNHQISPVQIENEIIKHPGVLDAAVTGIPDDECGELPAAFVVRHEGYDVSVHEIKDLVKGSLSDPKHLRGGVVFVTHLPLTSTSKIDRQKVKKMGASLKNE